MRNEPRRRPKPERQAPLRGPQTAHRRPDEDTPKRRTRGPLRSSEDVVIQTVKLGYKIADEQIARGQEFARRLRGASLRSDSGDVGDLVDQGVRLVRQLAVLLVEAAETGLYAPAIVKNMARAPGPREPAATNHESVPQENAPTAAPATAQNRPTTNIPIKVRSTRPAQVSISLQRELKGQPEVYPLYLQGDPAVSLRGVELERSTAGTSYCLSVRIADEQRAGTYRGCAVEKGSDEIVALITVIIEGAQ